MLHLNDVNTAQCIAYHTFSHDLHNTLCTSCIIMTVWSLLSRLLCSLQMNVSVNWAARNYLYYDTSQLAAVSWLALLLLSSRYVSTKLDQLSHSYHKLLSRRVIVTLYVGESSFLGTTEGCGGRSTVWLIIGPVTSHLLPTSSPRSRHVSVVISIDTQMAIPSVQPIATSSI